MDPLIEDGRLVGWMFAPEEVPDNFTMDVFADWKQMGYMTDG